MRSRLHLLRDPTWKPAKRPKGPSPVSPYQSALTLEMMPPPYIEESWASLIPPDMSVPQPVNFGGRDPTVTEALELVAQLEEERLSSVSHTGSPGDSFQFNSDSLDLNVNSVFIFCCIGATQEEMETVQMQIRRGDQQIVTRFPIAVLEHNRSIRSIFTIHESWNPEELERARHLLERELEACAVGSYNSIFVSFQVSVNEISHTIVVQPIPE